MVTKSRKSGFLPSTAAVAALAIILSCGTSFAVGRTKTESEIHQAAKAGDVARLKDLLARDPKLIDSRDENGMTPLHHAVREKRPAAVDLLISGGADVQAQNVEKSTPLHLAAIAGDAAAVKRLLAAGADPKIRDIRGRQALFLACGAGNDLETVRFLVAAGADVNDVSTRGENTLLSTLYFGKKEVIEFLLESGARLPEDEPSLGRALFVSAGNGLDRVVRLAVEAAEKKGMAWEKQVSLHAAARGGSVAVVETLVAKGAAPDGKNEYGLTPLHVAAENGRAEVVDFLLDRGAKADETTRMGQTAWHLARDNKHADLAARLKAKGASDAPPRFPELRGPYLGQPDPGDTPKVFAPGIVSQFTFNSEHSPVAFSPDGTEAYWTQKFRGPILFMKQENGLWTPPRPAPFNTPWGDGEPIFTPDGKRLYFLSFRPLEPNGKTDKENIWYVEREGEGWSAAQPVSALVNAFDHHWLFSAGPDGTLYFSSIREGGVGGRDIYISRLVDGRHEQPRNAGPVINTARDEHMPFIARDGSYLIFTSTGHPAAKGQFHFFISYRDCEGNWTTPVSLGEKIHRVEMGLCPLVTPDGTYMFMLGRGDICWVRADFIEALRPKK
jgi:ankyrin repeat protein